MSLLSFLREADFVTSVAIDSAILCFSFAAYRHHRMKAFAFLIWGSMVGIILAAGVRMLRATPQQDPNDTLTFWQLYRAGYIVATVLWGTGIILLIRDALARIDQGTAVNKTASPNGGLATRSGDSELTGRPPSVS